MVPDWMSNQLITPPQRNGHAEFYPLGVPWTTTPRGPGLMACKYDIECA